LISRINKKHLFILFLSVVFIDMLIKYLTVSNISGMDWMHSVFPYGGFAIFEDVFGVNFSLNYVANRGGAWGIFSSFHEVLLAFRIVVVIALAIFLCVFNKKNENRVAYTLIIAGAFGNIIDSFIYGHVVDMFHFVFWGYSYPVFNVADAAIFMAVAIMVINSLRSRNKSNFVLPNQPQQPMNYNGSFKMDRSSNPFNRK